MRMYNEEEIRRQAYQIYLSRQRFNIPGDAESDWDEARQIVSYINLYVGENNE